VPKFKTPSGELTAYALACGYIERKETPTLRLDLWHEGALYHVRAHDFAEHTRLFWESFDTLRAARAFYAKQIPTLFPAA